MTEQEFYQLKIGMIVFRKSTGTVAKLTNQFSTDKVPTPEDRLWANHTWPDVHADQAVKVAECEDWEIVRNLTEFKDHPFAYCNFLAMQMEDLEIQLRQRTIL